MDEVKYGLVKIIKGEFKGRFGFYDDDYFGDFDEEEFDEDFDEEVEDEDFEDEDEEELEEHPIVYLGDMFLNSPYVILNQDEITDKITKKDIENRIGEIIKGLFSTTNTKKRLALYEELVLLQSNYGAIDD